MMEAIKRRNFIIIPVHNRCALTRQCLESLQRQTLQNFSVIVVDDGSTDGTAEMLKNEFPEVVVIKGDGNLFWTASMNQGIKYALEQSSGDDHILFLNNDLVVADDYLEKMMSATQTYPKALIGSLSVDQKTKKIQDGGTLINWWTGKFRRFNQGCLYHAINIKGDCVAVDVLSGRGTLISVDVFKNIGFLNSDCLPQYGADYAFSVLAKRDGYDLWINYKSVVFSAIEETGLNNEVRCLSWGEWFKSFYSLKSSNALRYRWRFARLCCPTIFQAVVFGFFDMMRVIIGSFLRQVKNAV